MNEVCIRPTPTNEAALWAFLHSLKSSRLLPDSDVDDMQREVESDQQEALYEMLVEEGILTPYQLKRIHDGKPFGLIIGQYRILDELGQGGFGQVFKAHHTIMDRVVALKVISPEHFQERRIRDLFLREVVASTRLVHPNIALAYDANEVDNVLYLAMEYVEGPTLEKYVAMRGPLPVDLASAIILQTAQALQFAYENGMVHRDIKPGNIMLAGFDADPSKPLVPPTSAGVCVKVIDFGLARLHPPGTDQKATIIGQRGDIVGSPAFMSPEQSRNVHEVDIRSDLYSLGCTFYYALSGLLPFEGTTTQETFAMHREHDPLPLRSARPELPANVVGIVNRLMSKKPSERFQTPAELVEALRMPLLFGLHREPETHLPAQSRLVSSARVCRRPKSSPSSRKPLHRAPPVRQAARHRTCAVPRVIRPGRRPMPSARCGGSGARWWKATLPVGPATRARRNTRTCTRRY